VSRIATRLHAASGHTGKPLAMAFEIGFASEIISGRQLALLVGIETTLAKNQSALFEEHQMTIDARA
jgi:hypothetical protein